MKPWSAAETLLAVYLPGCPWPTIEDALRTVSRDYFSRTLAWTSTLEPQLSTVGGTEYDAVDETDAEPVKIHSATYDGYQLDPLTRTDFSREKARNKGNSNPRYISFNGESVVVWPPPNMAGREIIIEASYQPTLNARGLPDGVWSEHIDAIAYGVQARLKAFPDQPFSDPKGAETAARLYRAAIGTAGIVATKGNTRARTNSTARYY